jgi:hypothetical protein
MLRQVRAEGVRSHTQARQRKFAASQLLSDLSGDLSTVRIEDEADARDFSSIAHRSAKTGSCARSQSPSKNESGSYCQSGKINEFSP